MRIEVTREWGVRFAAEIRGHRVTYDQPIEAGGTDAGPTPTEAFVASLAGCVAYYAERFLHRHDVSPVGLAVTADFSMAQHPSRVGEIALRVSVPAELPESLRAPLRAVVEHCTVHNSIVVTPTVRIELDASPALIAT